MYMYEEDIDVYTRTDDINISDMSNLFGVKVNVVNSEVSGLERGIITDDTAFLYEKEIRQLHRVEHCGEFYISRDPTTGGYKVIPNYCDLHCMCDVCLGRRAYMYCERLKSACEDGELHSITTNFNTWSNIRKEFPGEENYLCFPRPDGMVISFVNDIMFSALSKTKHAKLFKTTDKYALINSYDWKVITKTPDKRKMSGKLGEKIVEPKESFGEVVNIQTNLSRDSKQADLSEITQINNEVMDATADLDPHTLVEVQAAMYKRDTMFIEIAKSHGYEVKSRRRNVKLTLNPNSISWVNYYALTVASREMIKQRKADFRRSMGFTDDIDT